MSLQPGQVALLVHVDGSHESVQRQIAEGEAICAKHGAVGADTLDGEALLALWERQEVWRTASPTPDLLQVRIGVPPSNVEAALGLLDEVPGFCREPVRWLADAGIGSVSARLPLKAQADDPTDQVQVWLDGLRARLDEQQGFAVVASAPENLITQLDVWGTPPGIGLLKLYKSRFDPQGILNPGRYVGGL